MGSTDLKPSPKPNRSTVDFLDANFTLPTLPLSSSLSRSSGGTQHSEERQFAAMDRRGTDRSNLSIVLGTRERLERGHGWARGRSGFGR